MYQFELDVLVQRAALRIKSSSGSRKEFLKITRQVVEGTGLRDKSDLDLNTKKVRDALTAHSATARSLRGLRTQSAKISKRIRDRVSP